MKVNLDRTSSGFCFGVQGTINVAEEKLRQEGTLFSLGDVVHNEAEVHRLEALGLETIDEKRFRELKGAHVLIRAHGEPPETYRLAAENNLTLTDTTCPVVARLQQMARTLHKLGYQIIIYGKRAHPEVIGINGQCDNRALIIKHADLGDPEELEALDFNMKTALISQTTMDVPGFEELKANLEARFSAAGQSEAWSAIESAQLKAATEGDTPMPRHLFKDTICRQVSNRNQKLHDFALSSECVIFVAGRKSSNGQVLFNICREANPLCYFIEDVEEIQEAWLKGADGKPVASAGVCGATSTPMWHLENVARYLEEHFGGEHGLTRTDTD